MENFQCAMENSSFWADNSSINWSATFLLAWLGLTGFCAVVLNALICGVFCTHRNLRTTGNYFFLNLAICDILVGVLIIPWKIVCYVEVNPKWLLCLTAFVDYILSMSFLSICALTYDRYQAIIHPLHYQLKMHLKKSWKIFVSVWCVPSVHFLRFIWLLPPDNPDAQQSDNRFHIFLFSFIVIASVMIAWAYYCILQAASRQELCVQGRAGIRLPRGEKIRRKLKFSKAIGSCLAVTICFTVCWIPRGSYFVSRLFISGGYTYDLATFGLMTLSSSLNPVIYTTCSRDIRMTVIYLICKKRRIRWFHCFSLFSKNKNKTREWSHNAVFSPIRMYSFSVPN